MNRSSSARDGANRVEQDGSRNDLFPIPATSRDLPRAHRPREKLWARGASHLSASELIAVVLGTGSPGRSAAAIAGDLVRRHGIAGLAALDVSGWRAERGLGAASAARLCAAIEIGRRVHAVGRAERPRVTRPRLVWPHVRHLGRARKEHLIGLYLDAQNGLIHRETISIGSLNTTRTHPREILYPAVEHLALGFVLAHNHPSGCVEPSPEDVEFTRAVGRAGTLMGIELYDHLIVAGDGFVSLRERGVL